MDSCVTLRAISLAISYFGLRVEVKNWKTKGGTLVTNAAVVIVMRKVSIDRTIFLSNCTTVETTRQKVRMINTTFNTRGTISVITEDNRINGVAKAGFAGTRTQYEPLTGRMHNVDLASTSDTVITTPADTKIITIITTRTTFKVQHERPWERMFV